MLLSPPTQGAGLILVFLSLFSYIIDTYLFAAATALAATTVIRSLFGFAFPLVRLTWPENDYLSLELTNITTFHVQFANQMYTTLNPRFAGLILALITVLFIPIPLLFLKFGPKIRGMSKNAANKR